MSTDKTIIILCIGRCGSSMVGGVLDKLGVFMGSHLVEANSFNTKGYYEDQTIMELQDALLKSMGCSWWRPPANIWSALGYGNADIATKLCKAIQRRTDDEHTLWGFKDPRTMYLLPVYRKQLVNPHFIVVHRNLLSVAKSIFHRDHSIVGESFGEAMALAERHAAHLVHTVNDPWMADKPLIHVSYEDMLDNPTAAVLWISKFVNVEDFEKMEDASEFIDKGMKTW